MVSQRRIPTDVIDQIRSDVNILDIIGQYVQLHRSGSNWFGLCPFHTEKTGSFSVNEPKQFFHCFSCGRGGNVFKFLMEIEDLTFPEAVYRTAELAGIELDAKYLPQNIAGAEDTQSETGRLKQLYAQAGQLYHHILVNTKLGQPALDYLHERGLSDELIAEFQLGYAPQAEILQAFFHEKKLDDYQTLRKSGLFSEREGENLAERFNDRIMFPIRNQTGQIIAFSGRLLTPDKKLPKYLNSPEGILFNKRKVLFNFDKAKKTIRHESKVYLFEGFMDVLAAWRAGIKNGVASMGTSLTSEQIYLLEQTASKLYICYDGDLPGRKATKRALELIAPLSKFELGTILLPEKLDPDEYVRKYGPENFKDFVTSHERTELEFYLEYFRAGRNLETESDQLAYITDVLERVAQVKDPLARDLTINRLAKEFELDKNNLTSQLQVLMQQVQSEQLKQDQANSLKRSDKVVYSTQQRQEKKRYTPAEQAERLLLYRLLHEHDVFLRIKGLADFSFIHEDYETIFLLADGYFDRYSEYESASFLDFLKDEHLRQIIISLELGDYGESNEQEISDCLAFIMQHSPLEEQIKAVEAQLEQAKRLGDAKAIMEQTTKLIELLKKKQTEKSII
ncbi:DNA primase [Ligilactobacillus animalis]|uniref:DNA primase n=1 Tax=Ligilactobacillus animalis TaxID=1605 RepID=UPI0008241899|nr:DNA primase [Ligilactobacillus animalis]MDO5882809.1 DNA primase [Ligilactobacillus animalis]MDU1487309.1 DNA primase [Ligilactobacillus animalis]MDU8985973.1 DNA primase [Ligilactobacillus animalis]OCX47767.1 DNA primase [Ligilactobacillus animalis]THE20856.1 DNA primase [Ligilactobacillus animalis]